MEIIADIQIESENYKVILNDIEKGFVIVNNEKIKANTIEEAIAQYCNINAMDLLMELTGNILIIEKEHNLEERYNVILNKNNKKGPIIINNKEIEANTILEAIGQYVNIYQTYPWDITIE